RRRGRARVGAEMAPSRSTATCWRAWPRLTESRLTASLLPYPIAICRTRSPGEVPVVALDLLGRRGAGEDQDAVAERCGFSWPEPEVQLRFPVGEGLPAEWVGGEQAVASGVPVRREADVLRV